MFKKFKDSPYWKAALVMLLAGGILIVFNNWITKTQFSVGFEALGNTLTPIIIGVVLAFLVCPIYNKCVEKAYAKLIAGKSELDDKVRRKQLTNSRIIATVICLIIVVGFVGGLIYSLVPQVVNSCIELVNTLPERLMSLSKWVSVHFSHFPQLADWLEGVAKLGTGDLVTWVQKNVLGENAIGLATMISSGVVTAVNYVLDAFIGILIMVYLLNYKETLFAMCRKFISATCTQKRQDGLYEFSDIFNETFVGFIVGRIIDSTIIGILTYIVLLICQIPFAPMISVIVGVTNVIPFFGPFIGAIPSILILMLEDPVKALWFAVIILIIQQIDGNIIGPKIVGNVIGIGSFWVLVAVLIGGGLFGFGGMVFGVPVFALIYRYVNKVTTRTLRKKGQATHTSDYFTLDQFGIDASEVHLEVHDRKEKSIISKFRKSGNKYGVVEEVISLEPQIEESERNEELEAIKNRIADELLGPQSYVEKTITSKVQEKIDKDVR
ncbi:MAG: AI-2E family transporter [Prevotellaceae bacterium]|nr:AI-2E family transporter [Candidatus Faecinaster equi]